MLMKKKQESFTNDSWTLMNQVKKWCWCFQPKMNIKFSKSYKCLSNNELKACYIYALFSKIKRKIKRKKTFPQFQQKQQKRIIYESYMNQNKVRQMSHIEK